MHFCGMRIAFASTFPPYRGGIAQFNQKLTEALLEEGHEVHYSKKLPRELSSFDLYIVVSSIVCCETECENIRIISIKVIINL